MTITLYHPGIRPQCLPANEFITQPGNNQIVQDVAHAAELLGCSLELVDVLACGNGYLVYSVFNDDGDVNPVAMVAVAEISGTEIDPTNSDEVLRGPILVVKTSI